MATAATNLEANTEIPEWKWEAYRDGSYSLPAPPVFHTGWTNSDWVRYIDSNGHWYR